MTDYSKWKEGERVVTSLLLDPNNPRIPEISNNPAQNELLAELVENDKVYELAKNIADNGYSPVESIIYVKENGKDYVIEGNRRLAALKLLISPDAAPTESSCRRFRALSNRIDPNTIHKVKAILAPSREAAAPIIMSKHTRSQIESWGPLMQAKFYRNLQKRGLELSDITEQYNIPASEIAEAIQRYEMYLVACSLELPEDISIKVRDSRNFPITNLDRLLNNHKVNDFLGISFDENRQLKGSIHPEEFKKGFKKIITDIANGSVTSRNVNTVEEMDKYLTSFGESMPNLRKKGKFSTDTLLKVQTSSAEKSKRSIEKRIPKSKPNPQSLIPSNMTCDVNNQRIVSVFNELKRLHVAQYPNATGIMFRSLLEMGLSYYLYRTSHIQIIINNEKTKREKNGNNLPNDWHPTLQDMLKYVVDGRTNIIKNGNIIKSINKLISQKDKLISIDSLNLFVHNEHIYPNETTLREFWAQLQPLFEIILVEPSSDGNE